MSLNWDTKRWSLKYTSRFGDDSIKTTAQEVSFRIGDPLSGV